jgi:hypothetical protein
MQMHQPKWSFDQSRKLIFIKVDPKLVYGKKCYLNIVKISNYYILYRNGGL